MTLTRADYRKGRKFRVVKEGARLTGMKPIAPYAQQGWAQPLAVGTIITCRGVSMTFGDGVPVVKWADAEDKWLANDCKFSPSAGDMWSQLPNSDYIEPID